MSKMVKFRPKLPAKFIYWGDDLEFERPVLGLDEDKRTVTRIMNACKNCIVEIDLSIYISQESLSDILRVKAQSKLNRIKAEIHDEDKLDDISGTNFNEEPIALGEVLKLINKELVEARDESKRIYLRVAEKSLINMRDCDKLKVLAAQNDRKYNKELKGLKAKRKKLYKIKIDELTGKKLERDADFSHIRSKASYPKLALNIENGLLVNKDIHKIITDENVEDEDQLEALCIREGWSLDWKSKFCNMFIL